MPSARQLSPAQFLAFSISALVLIGGVLLSLPLSHAPGRSVSVLNAFFTATSAVCVTGLVVVDVPVDLSPAGHVVLLLLIQAGGLGYMALSTLITVALGKALTVQERLTLQEALNATSLEGIARFTVTVFKLTLVFELAGALLLAARWAGELGVGRALWYGLFHAVSGFNNAGFALWSDNLIRWRGDWLVNLVITTLVICGGIGFLVLAELGRWRDWRRLSTHARLVLTITGLLLAAGTGGLLLLEWHNPRTLGPLPLDEKLLAAWFQAVSPRTAGFNTVDIGALTPAALFLLVVLMFIGASPGGTGGGVKTTTFGITVVALWNTVRGGEEPHLFRRRLPPPLVARAFFISLIAFLALNIVAGLLLVTEKRDLLPVLFETTSAFGTVGLSIGEAPSPLSLAGHFSAAGKLLVMLVMFMGRVGPLTLAVAVARGRPQPRIRFPEGKVLVG